MNAAHAAQPRCASENGIRARTVQHALAWLSQHVSSAANLHADSRAIQPGDAYLAYAVQGADSRTYIDDAIARGAAAVIWQPSSEHAAPPWTVPNFQASDVPDLADFITRQWYVVPGREDARDWHHRQQRQTLMRSLDCARLDGGGHALRDQRNARLRHARSIDRNGIYHAACAANAAQSCATGSVRRSRRCARSLLACAASEACERRYLRYRRVYPFIARSSRLSRHA